MIQNEHSTIYEAIGSISRIYMTDFGDKIYFLFNRSFFDIKYILKYFVIISWYANLFQKLLYQFHAYVICRNCTKWSKNLKFGRKRSTGIDLLNALIIQTIRVRSDRMGISIKYSYGPDRTRTVQIPVRSGT